jgi:uncharacterized protein YggE
MRTIRVTGKGQLKVHPDTTRITIDLARVCREYGDAVEASAKDTEALRDELVPFGFGRKDLKTLHFDVSPEFESYKVNDVYKRKLIGYKYEHTLKVEFPSDNKLLGRILFMLGMCYLKPEFRISYTVKNPEAVKNELLEKAVRDAMEKAGVLSKAAGLQLGDIQSMDYSWGRIEYEIQCMDKLSCAEMPIEGKGYNLDIEPDDIDTEDTVTVVWEIR